MAARSLSAAMRTIAFVLTSLIATTTDAATTFVSPLEGAQAIGPLTIEVTTDVKNVDRVDFFVDDVFAGVARTAPYRIAYDFGTTLAARRIAAKVWSGGFKTFETAVVTTAGLTENDVLNVDLVELPIRVRAPRPLRRSDLRVLENGVEQTIRDVRQERPPAHFAFVVDRSLSMNGGKLEAAVKAVQNALGQLREGDTASLILFNHQVAKAQPIRSGETLVPDVVPSGGTSLRDALASAASKQRTYAFVITDGGDRNSELSDDDALRKISGTRTIVNALVLGDSHASFLDKAAANTGGSVTSATRATVSEELARMLEDINGRYLVIYQSKGTERGWRTAVVSPRLRNIVLSRARKDYFAE